MSSDSHPVLEILCSQEAQGNQLLPDGNKPFKTETTETQREKVPEMKVRAAGFSSTRLASVSSVPPPETFVSLGKAERHTVSGRWMKVFAVDRQRRRELLSP